MVPLPEVPLVKRVPVLPTWTAKVAPLLTVTAPVLGIAVVPVNSTVLELIVVPPW